MPKVRRSARPGLRTGRSESEPIVTATRGCGEVRDDGMEDLEDGLGSPFLSARMSSTRLSSGDIRDSPVSG